MREPHPTIMDKTTSREALRFAAMGNRVLVLAETMPRAQAVLDDMMDAYPEELTRPMVRRVHGRYAVQFDGGGTIRFYSLRSSHRGYSVDRVYVPLGTAGDVLAQLWPALAVSGGTIVGYGVERVEAPAPARPRCLSRDSTGRECSLPPGHGRHHSFLGSRA